MQKIQELCFFKLGFLSQIIKRATRIKEEPEIVKPEEGTVFTEEDFIKFEREYVVD